jgi:hypothetical protein
MSTSKPGLRQPHGTGDRDKSERINRARKFMRAYKKAFAGFSDLEMLLLDGIILDGPGKRRGLAHTS